MRSILHENGSKKEIENDRSRRKRMLIRSQVHQMRDYKMWSKNQQMDAHFQNSSVTRKRSSNDSNGIYQPNVLKYHNQNSNSRINRVKSIKSHPITHHQRKATHLDLSFRNMFFLCFVFCFALCCKSIIGCGHAHLHFNFDQWKTTTHFA